ncbi:hypothetical protein D9615_004147 [Tricholomella constricta]|uniref:Monopolin complex subunit Csm1/Pcs1 C-terminal domain-containing protein n=1 Tax=Tricholomella constricta TaxID=117010 RepID=A0A8H5HCM9_9AGAR|nr:hypothetical protein D9615_004147 [Tricholomella constricta]
MSDDDDFGGFGPTTPALHIKKPAPRAAKPNSRTQAGPSSKPKGGRKNAPVPLSDNSEIEVVPYFDFTKQDDDEEDEEHPATPLQPTRKAQATRTEAPVANGKPNAKGKGKAKAPQMKGSRKLAPEPMDVVPIEIIDEPNEERGATPELADAINAAGRSRQTNSTKARPGKGDEVSRMAEKLRRAEERIKTLEAQLQEVFQIRETEPERLMKQQEAHYEDRLRAQEQLIREYQTQLMMKEPLMRSGNIAVLNLLTREAADEEMRAIQEEVARWKELANEKQRAMTQRDERIAQLEQAEKDLRFELKAEIDRSAALAKSTRAPSMMRSGRPGGVEDPRHAEVLRFYEDLTNLLVPHMKTQPGEYFGLEDWVLSCIYTFNDDDAPDQANAAKKSLNFTLRFCHEPPDALAPERVTSKEQLVPTVHFTPLELDKEPPEFVEKLDFLKAAFSFGRNQLPLFLRTTYQRMSEAVLEDEDEEDMEGD